MVVTVAVSAVKVVHYLIEGKIEEAAKEAVSTAIGVGAGMVAGAAGTAMFAGIAFGIEAEIEGLKGAAAMIAYCREENRKHGDRLLLPRDRRVQGGGQGLRGRSEGPGRNPEDRQEWPKAEANLASYARWWGICLKRLSGQMDHERKDVIGGQPEFLEALGPEAVNIMLAGEPASTYEGIAKQVHTLLDGATMLSYHLAEKRRPRTTRAGGGASGQGGRRLTHHGATHRACCVTQGRLGAGEAVGRAAQGPTSQRLDLPVRAVAVPTTRLHVRHTRRGESGSPLSDEPWINLVYKTY